MIFYFVCHTKGGKNIEGVVRRRKIENKWTLETGSNRVIGKNYIINSSFSSLANTFMLIK
jgi:hypothetical protein